MGMLRLLKTKKNYIYSLFLLLISAIIAISELWYLCVIPLVLIIAIYVNSKASKILASQTSYAYGHNQIRNAKYLVIGDLYKAEDLPQDNVVYIQTPGKTLEGAFLVLKRMFSILDENNGKAIIAIKKTGITGGITLFEYSFLSNIYKEMLKHLRLDKKRRLPIIYSPLKTLMLLLNVKYKKATIAECPNLKIVNFCRERSIQFEFRYID